MALYPLEKLRYAQFWIYVYFIMITLELHLYNVFSFAVEKCIEIIIKKIFMVNISIKFFNFLKDFILDHTTILWHYITLHFTATITSKAISRIGILAP